MKKSNLILILRVQNIHWKYLIKYSFIAVISKNIGNAWRLKDFKAII